MRLAAALLGLALASSNSAAEQQDSAQQHVRGDVVAVHGDTLDVRTRAGQVVHLALAGNVGVAQVEEAGPEAITDGAFVGTTAVPQPDGTLRALEVHVFPKVMRGAGEGHRPWDLQTGSSMTNATVSGMGPAKAPAQGTGSSMTNATVSGVQGSGATRTLHLTYQGGEQTVVVPSGIPVVKLSPANRSILVPGAHVFALAKQQGDGSLFVDRMVVGKDGVVPPM